MGLWVYLVLSSDTQHASSQHIFEIEIGISPGYDPLFSNQLGGLRSPHPLSIYPVGDLKLNKILVFAYVRNAVELKRGMHGMLEAVALPGNGL
jgi:hypothetical protein